jgi:putative transcriptional regulator
MQTKIKEYRNSLGLTQEELAARVQVRRETIVFLEKGKYNPSLRLAHAVAKALGTTVEELFSFDDEEGGGSG